MPEDLCPVIFCSPGLTGNTIHNFNHIMDHAETLMSLKSP